MPMGCNIEHILAEIHPYFYVSCTRNIIWYYMQSFMNRNNQNRKNNSTQKSMCYNPFKLEI